jgi:hypothetical protein
LEQRRVIIQERDLLSLDLVGLYRPHVPTDVVPGLRELLQHVLFDGRHRTEPRCLCITSHGRVETGEVLGDSIDVLAPELTVSQEVVCASLIWKARHVHGPVDGLARAPNAVHTVGTPPNGDDAQVHLGREACVQLHLRLARQLSLFDRAKIEEAEVDGLLDLVDLAREEDPRDVGLDELDAGCRRCICAWTLQVLLDGAHRDAGSLHRACPRPPSGLPALRHDVVRVTVDVRVAEVETTSDAADSSRTDYGEESARSLPTPPRLRHAWRNQ